MRFRICSIGRESLYVPPLRPMAAASDVCREAAVGEQGQRETTVQVAAAVVSCVPAAGVLFGGPHVLGACRCDARLPVCHPVATYTARGEAPSGGNGVW